MDPTAGLGDTRTLPGLELRSLGPQARIKVAVPAELPWLSVPEVWIQLFMQSCLRDQLFRPVQYLSMNSSLLATH
jgi:hypothetical protein